MKKRRPKMRPVLSRFAALMEAKLAKNDHKTDWKDLPVEALFRMLMIEIEEFKLAHEYLPINEAQNELVDVANFCLILHDRLGMEKK
jgi:hypothetical protein